MTPSADSSRQQSPAEEQGPTQPPKTAVAFLLKFPLKLRFPHKQSQTKQRRKTFARRGDEIGLKALSQPTGTRARDCDCSGAGDPNPRRQAAGWGRSPLSARFTHAAGGG